MFPFMRVAWSGRGFRAGRRAPPPVATGISPELCRPMRTPTIRRGSTTPARRPGATPRAHRKEAEGGMSNKAPPMKRSVTPTPPVPTAGHQTLSTYIQSRFEDFSRSQKDVAQYIVDHLDEVAFQTAEELARRANTSSSTVVRFSQALGFEGYPELQQSAREESRRRPAEGAKPVAAEPLFSLDHTEFEAALAADH